MIQLDFKKGLCLENLCETPSSEHCGQAMNSIVEPRRSGHWILHHYVTMIARIKGNRINPPQWAKAFGTSNYLRFDALKTVLNPPESGSA